MRYFDYLRRHPLACGFWAPLKALRHLVHCPADRLHIELPKNHHLNGIYNRLFLVMMYQHEVVHKNYLEDPTHQAEQSHHLIGFLMH